MSDIVADFVTSSPQIRHGFEPQLFFYFIYRPISSLSGEVDEDDGANESYRDRAQQPRWSR